MQFSVPFNYLHFWALSTGKFYSQSQATLLLASSPLFIIIFSSFLSFFLLFDVATERAWPLWCSPAMTAATVVLPFYLPLFCSWKFHVSLPTGFCLLGLFYLSFCLFVSLAWKLFHAEGVRGQQFICNKVQPLHIFHYFSRVWPDLEQCTDCREDWKFSLKLKLKNSRGILIHKEVSSRLREAVWLVTAICTTSNAFPK